MLPILKWTGGKRRSLNRILPFFPKECKTFHDKFCGGLSVSMAYAQYGKYKKIICSDFSETLIAFYEAIQHKSLRELALQPISLYNTLSKEERKEYYFQVRKEYNEDILDKAYLLYFLNRAGFNGLYRFNARGEYNVPAGTCEEILPSSFLLQPDSPLFFDARLEPKYESFEKESTPVEKGDIVYLDPPYVPTSKTSSFVRYTSSGFPKEQQELLLEKAIQWKAAGAHVFISNSYCEESLNLYRGFQIEIIELANTNAASSLVQGKRKEILVIL